MTKKKPKRLLGLFLSLAMIFTLTATPVFAADTGISGEVEVVSTTDESVDNTTLIIAEAESVDDVTDVTDTTETETTLAVVSIQAQIAALPSVDDAASMSEDEILTVYNQVSAIWDAYYELTEDEQAEVDTEVLEAWSDYFNGGVAAADDDDNETSTSTSVASIGDNTYETLASAFAAAASGDTIIMTADATVDTTISVSTDVILDLNGQTITASTTLFKVSSTGALTVCDSETEGKIIISSESDVYFVNGAGADVNVAIQSGAISVTSKGGKAVLIWNSSVNITGGTFTVSGSSSAHGIYAKSGDTYTSTISGDDVSLTVTENDSPVTAANLVSGSVTITGGTYNVSPTASLLGEGYGVTGNSDGTYTVVNKVVATVTINGTATSYTSIYSALKAANSASSDATITMTADIDSLASTMTFNNSNAVITLDLAGYSVTTANEFTGSNVFAVQSEFILTDRSEDNTGSLNVSSSTIVAVIDNASTMTFSGGTISFISTYDTAQTAAIKNNSNASVTMSGSAAIIASKNSGSGSGTKSMVGISDAGGTVSLSGGSISVSSSIGDAYGISGSGASTTVTVSGGSIAASTTAGSANAAGIWNAYVTMTDGTVSATSSGGTAYGIYGKANSDGTYSSVSGGTVTVSGSTNSCISGSIGLTGGTYSHLNVSSWVAENYAVYSNASGTYTVAAEGMVAMVAASDNTTTYYSTLTDAVSAASSDDTVTLLKDVTENITITKGQTITLDLAGCTLTGSATYAISVKGGTFTLKDSGENGTVEVEDYGYVIYVYSSSSNGNAKFTMESGTITGGSSGGIYAAGSSSSYRTYVTVSGGSITGNGRGVCVYKYTTLTMSGGTISENETTGSGGGVYMVNSGTSYRNVFKMTGGEITGNTASTGGGVYAETSSNSYYFQLSGGAVYNNTATGNANDIYATNVNNYTNATILNASSMTTSYNYWRDASDGTLYSDTTSLSGTVYLTAVTGDETYDTYTVTYDANSGDGTVPADSISYTYGMIVTVAEGDELTKDGYYLSGWNTASDGTGTDYSAGDTFFITEDVTLYAVWKETVAVVLDTDGNIVGYYNTLSSAVSGASGGQTVQLVKDITLSGYVNITKVLTIDLNGHDITFSTSHTGTNQCIFYLSTSGSKNTLTLKNSGSTGGNVTNNSSYASNMLDMVVYIARGHLVVESGVTLTSTNGYCIYLGGYTTAYNNGTIQATVEIDGGTVSGGVVGIAVVGDTKNTTSYGPILTVNSGTITGGTYGMAGNGTSTYGQTFIYINGGTIIGTSGTGIYHPQVGTLTVTGGTITGCTGIEMRSGTLTVSDGTIKGTATSFTTVSNGSGTTVDGAGIAVSQHTTDNEIAVTISGGEISGYYGIYEVNYNSAPTSDVSITVSGGVVEATGDGAKAIYSNSLDTESESVNGYTNSITAISISGGHFSSEVEEDYCAEGYEPYTETGTEYATDGVPHTVAGSITLCVYGSSTTTVPATIVSGNGTSTMYVKVSGDYIGTDGYYSTSAYPTTSLTYTSDSSVDSGSYIFAGWYTLDEDDSYIACTSDMWGSSAAAYYAKFVDANVLSVICVYTPASVTGSNPAWRFVSSLDSGNYDEFYFCIDDTTQTVTTYYSNVEVQSVDKTFTGSDFSSASQKVTSYGFLDNASTPATGYTVKVGWKTSDGTTVYGAAYSFDASEYTSASILYGSVEY